MSEGADALGVLETVDSPVIDTAVESPETTLDQQPTGDENIPVREEGEDSQPKADARLLPKDVQRLLKSLRDADPANAAVVKQLNDAFFRERAYSQLGKIEDIQGLKSKFEDLGGDEGITTLRASQELLTKLDQDYADGNPEVLNDIPEEGFKKLISPALDRLERMDQAAYSNTMRPHLVRALEAARLPDVLGTVRYLLGRGDVEEATKHLNSVDKWMGDQRGLVEESRRNVNDPKLADITRREQALKQSEENQFRGRVAGEVVGKMNSEITKVLGGEQFKGLKDEQKTRLTKMIYADVEDILRGDKNYQQNVKAAIAGKDTKRLTGYVNSTVNGLVTRVARDLRNTLFPNLGASPTPGKTAANGARRPGAGTTPSAPGSKPLMLSGKPPDGEIDWHKTGDPTMAIIRHQVWTKKGQLVTWK